MRFEEPNNISISKKSNEENISSIRSYLAGNADNLNYLVSLVESQAAQIASLQSEIEKLKS